MGSVHPVTLLVPPSSAEPMQLVIEGYGLKMVVINKESLSLLGSEWDTLGVYFLLGRAEDPNRYTAYVGEASKRSLRMRVQEHVRVKEQWDRALLITSTDGFDSAAIGWMEGRLWDVLQNAAAAEVLNRNQPKDESIPEYRRAVLERYVEPVMMALRALGCPPDTADQKPPAPTRRKRYFKESVKDLIDAGLLKPGTRLRPLRRNLDEPATVLPDGSLQVGEDVYGAVSPAAQAVSGNTSEPGWEFWGAPSGDGRLVSLYELRERLRAASGTDAPGPPATPPPASPPSPQPTGGLASTPTPARRTKVIYEETVADLIAAGLLQPGQTLHPLRKRVTATAKLGPNGTVDLEGRAFGSLSAAAENASGGKGRAWLGVLGHRTRRPEGLAVSASRRAAPHPGQDAQPARAALLNRSPKRA